MSEQLDLSRYGDEERKDWKCVSVIWDEYSDVAYVIEGCKEGSSFDGRLVNDAPVLLAEVKRLRAFQSQVLSGCDGHCAIGECVCADGGVS